MNSARRSLPSEFAAHGILIAFTVIALFPVLLILINSFKDRRAIFQAPLALPSAESFSLIGYATVFEQGNFALYFFNSFVVTVVALALVLILGAMAAFALAEYRFAFNPLLGLYLAIGIMIPIWNDLWFPLILAPGETVETITLGTQVFIGQFVTNWNAVLAGFALAILPVLVLYLVFSKQLIRGITSGAVK